MNAYMYTLSHLKSIENESFSFSYKNRINKIQRLFFLHYGIYTQMSVSILVFILSFSAKEAEEGKNTVYMQIQYKSSAKMEYALNILLKKEYSISVQSAVDLS